MEASYFIKGQTPDSAIYEVHTSGIKFELGDLVSDYPWLGKPTVPVRDKSIFLAACCAQVAAVEGLRYGITSEKQAMHTITVAKGVIKEMTDKHG